MKDIVLTDYMHYRAKLRGYDLERIKEILRFGTEKYFDSETGSVELSPNMTAELDEQNEIIGIEIIGASKYLRDSILESAQAKLPALRNRS